MGCLIWLAMVGAFVYLSFWCFEDGQNVFGVLFGGFVVVFIVIAAGELVFAAQMHTGMADTLTAARLGNDGYLREQQTEVDRAQQ